MFAALARFIVRFRVAILVAAVAFMAIAATYGRDVADHLSSGGFDVLDAESTLARQVLLDEFGQGEPDVVLLISALGSSVDAQDVVAAATALEASVGAETGVLQVASYWSLGSAPPLRNLDKDRALIFVRIEGNDSRILERTAELQDEYAGNRGPIEVDFAGPGAVFSEVNKTIESELARSEGIALPITLLLMVLVFGSLVSASLPVGVALIAIVGTLLVLKVVTLFTEVSIFALNMTTVMGLGLAIDYALLIVNRYREETDAGFDGHEAVRRTVQTAGRTVAFSAGTVAASLSALLVFPMSFLRSFAFAGVGVVTMAAGASIVVLPALMAVLGHRVNALRVRKATPVHVGEGAWHRLAVAVMHRPWPVAIAVVAFLVFLGLPFLRLELGLPDDRVLAEGAQTRVIGDIIRAEFNSFEAGAVNVVATDIGNPASQADAISSYAIELSRIAGVARVDAGTGSYADGSQILGPVPSIHARFNSADSTYLSLVPNVEPISSAGEAIVHDARSVEAPFEVMVGGNSASLVDSKKALIDALPLALLIIAVVTFVVLFLSFGSVVVPLKAIVLNLLSLTAMFGALVWIFQDGHFAGFLGFTAVGQITIATPILMFCIAFGLSMDYEVFLLSRVKEEYDRTGDNEHSVAVGLERTGRIITAAAALIAIVFLATAFSTVRFIQLFGIGLALAVLVDAFLIRATLVPAFMKLAGRANWWAPPFLKRIYDRFGFSEHVTLDDDVEHEASRVSDVRTGDEENVLAGDR